MEKLGWNGVDAMKKKKREEEEEEQVHERNYLRRDGEMLGKKREADARRHYLPKNAYNLLAR